MGSVREVIEHVESDLLNPHLNDADPHVMRRIVSKRVGASGTNDGHVATRETSAFTVDLDKRRSTQDNVNFFGPVMRVRSYRASGGDDRHIDKVDS
jgi:hypothetical protein